MTNYTILLSRPEHYSQGPNDTYLAHVQGETVKIAQEAAQREAYDVDFPEAKEKEPLGHTRYPVLFVAEGHLEDVRV